MTDLGSMILDPIYESIIGVPAVIIPGTGVTPATITAVDKTSGAEFLTGNLAIATLKPAADVRLSELAQYEIEREDLSDGQITLYPDTNKEKTWRIESVHPRPGPQGEQSGELRLFLIDQGP